MSEEFGNIKLGDLDRQLFECANVLRDNVDKSRYKDFTLPLVFYAVASRRFDEAYEESLDQSNAGENPTDGEKELARDIASHKIGIKVPKNYSFDDLCSIGDPSDIAVEIDSAFAEMKKESPRDFSDIAPVKYAQVESFSGEEGGQVLKDLLQQIQGVDFDSYHPDVIGEAYMNLVTRFARQEEGEYFTPRSIIRLMVELLAPFDDGTRFHDPTVGSGGMLVEAAKYISEQENKDITKVSSDYTFTGQEVNPTILGMGKMNMFLHGISSELRKGDSLSNPKFTENGNLDKFDYILANFPFSKKKWKDGAKGRQKKYGDLNWADDGKLPNGNYGDYAFIMHMESHLSDKGRLATVIPHGILFRNSEQKYREYMVENDIVEAVIGLPENLFESASIPSGILILNKDKDNKKQDEVIFVNADKEGEFYEDTGSDRNVMTRDGVDRICNLYDDWEDFDRQSRVVNLDEIRENEYNMNIALYVDTTEPQEDIDVRDTLASVRDIEHEYQQLNQQFTQYMQQLNYEDETEETEDKEQDNNVGDKE